MDEKVSAILEGYKHDETFLVSILQDIQKEYNYLPKETLLQVSQSLKLPLSQVYHVATFFKAFSLKPRGRHIVSICMGTACHVRGAQKIVDRAQQRLVINPGETTEDGEFSLETVGCLGACALGPIVVIGSEYSGQMTVDKVDSLLKKTSTSSGR